MLYGDSYLPCDYAAVQRAFVESGKPGLMTVFRNDDQWDRSNVEFADGRILAYDKTQRTLAMRHIDYGLGVFAPARLRRRSARRAPRPGGRLSVAPRAGRARRLRGRRAVLRDRIASKGSRRRAATSRGSRSCRSRTADRHRPRAPDELRRAIPGGGEIGSSSSSIPRAIERIVALLADTRARGGRLFILGVGGSAANASHAVNDFRKIAGIEAYAPTDNVSELTARTNDEGWASVFEDWLRGSRLAAPATCVLVFSVGGGNLEKNVSPNLVAALQYAKEVGAQDRRHRRARRRLHGQGRRRLRDRPDREPGPRHAAHGGVPGRRLASAGVAPQAQGRRRPSGSPSGDGAAAAVFLDRDGVINRADRPGRQALSAGHARRAGDPARRAGGAGAL